MTEKSVQGLYEVAAHREYANARFVTMEDAIVIDEKISLWSGFFRGYQDVRKGEPT